MIKSFDYICTQIEFIMAKGGQDKITEWLQSPPELFMASGVDGEPRYLKQSTLPVEYDKLQDPPPDIDPRKEELLGADDCCCCCFHWFLQ
jgi:hypothetical protein